MRAALTPPAQPAQFPTAADLDASPVLRQYRLWLGRVDGHAALANGLALAAVGELPARNPAGGIIVRFANGTATGVFIDTAMLLVERVVPAALLDGVDMQRRALGLAMAECLRNGVTTVYDAGTTVDTVGVLRALVHAGTMPLRVHAMLMGPGETVPPVSQCAKRIVDEGGYGRLSVRAVKLFLDGSLGSRSAAMLAPYT